ncbi:pentapeptide repeat-containing protein [Plantactinospora sp. CA-290183]|uniref:pentapeptide repeat-containing protein n=1 Tax=Plantactinospora sp. CA-290183 TaxID=3240006 RepID=UPI003D947947
MARRPRALSELSRPPAPTGNGRTDLRADCERCFGLCCVVPAFAASADFAVDKPAGQPCPNLRSDSRCGIHRDLRQRGFPGCTVFDCFGAGQKVAQITFGGQDWRTAPAIAARMFGAFPVMQHLHELLWYLTEARGLAPAGALRAELDDALREIEALTLGSPEALAGLDVAARRREVNALLLRTSELVRAGRGRTGPDRRGADLVGADLRGADLGGADLRGSIFLLQSQLDAARGGADTRLPDSLRRPTHWSGSGTPVDRAPRAAGRGPRRSRRR